MLGMLQGFLGVGGDGAPVEAAPGTAATVPPVVSQLVQPMAAQMAARRPTTRQTLVVKRYY